MARRLKDQVVKPRRRKGRSPESQRAHKQYRYQKLSFTVRLPWSSTVITCAGIAW